MAPGISLDDRSAWDDSALINSWEEAVAEYQKYHSISKSGGRLEDVLSADELKQLREDHGDLMEAEDTKSGADAKNDADPAETALSEEHVEVKGVAGLSGTHANERTTPGHQETARPTETEMPHEGGLCASMPQALLRSVEDENMKNLIMSWYYAGYYTGLVTGQQQAATDNGPSQNQQ